MARTRTIAVFGLCALAACGDDTVGHDLAIPVDAGFADLASRDGAARDLSSPDLSLPDLALPDLALPDLTPVPDLFGCTLCNNQCAYLDRDPMNCGACGHVCGCGSVSCTAGVCDPAILADQQSAPFAFGLDSGLVYWSSDGDMTVYTVPAAGGPSVALFKNLTVVRGLAFDATRVFIARFNFNVLEVGLKTGGGVSNFSMAQEAGASGVVSDGTSLFWGDYGAGTVRTELLAGGATVSLETGQVHVTRLAVDGSYVYWTVADAMGGVFRAPKAGGPVQPLATQQAEPYDIAVDATYVYWNNQMDGTINRVPLAGGAIVQLATGRKIPYSIAIDADTIYWTDFSAGTVEKTALAGNAPVVTLAQNQDQPIAIAVDGTCVYFADYGQAKANAGSIRSTAKQ